MGARFFGFFMIWLSPVSYLQERVIQDSIFFDIFMIHVQSTMSHEHNHTNIDKAR